MDSKFLTGLHVSHVEGKGGKFDHPFIYYSKLLDLTILIPVGFVLDFASVPRLPLAYLFTGNTGHGEASFHDIGYRGGIKNERLDGDSVFYEIGIVRDNMRENQNFLHKKGRRLRNGSMATAVKGLGGTSYDPMVGCLDYRNKKLCKKEKKNCQECDKYYKKGEGCFIEGYYPGIIDLHEELKKYMYDELGLIERK